MEQIGRIQIERELGHGGMGVVYKGYDPFLQRPVAVKSVIVATHTSAHAANLVKRLEVEARAAARLSHPNIVAVYDIIPAADSFYVVMEFVDGLNLDTVAPEGSRPALPFVASIIRQCAAGLDHAHSRGVIHRDIKPSNIMLDGSGSVKIADFGIAKLLDSTGELTMGHAIGTMSYMSPEQLTGQAVDGRADQYSLAVVAYRMLAGSRQRSAPASMLNPMLRRNVDLVLERALALTAGERFGSCSIFAQELTDALAVSESGLEAQTVVGQVSRPATQQSFVSREVPNTPWVTPVPQDSRAPVFTATASAPRGSRPWIIAGALAAVLICGAAYLLLPSDRPAPQPGTASGTTASIDKAAEETWAIIKNSQSPDDFERFVKAFPDSALARGAEIRATELRREAVSPASVAKPAAGDQGASPDDSTAAWGKIRDSRNPEDFEKFAREFPQSRYRQAAEAHAEQLRHEEALRTSAKAEKSSVESQQPAMGVRAADPPASATSASKPPVPSADSTTSPNQRVRVGGTVQAANLINKLTPVYPALAKQARVQGTVRFEAIIGKDGTIQNLQLVSGHPLLVPAARDAVAQWVYKPMTLNREPVEVITQIEVNFTLSQ